MTRPSVIYFGPDGGTREVEKPKVYIRSLLFATAKRGRVLESMYATIRRSETRQNFNIWVLGEGTLARGGGIYVGEEGVLASHHFLLPSDSDGFAFVEGAYRLEIFAHVLGDQTDTILFSEELNIDHRTAEAMKYSTHGVYFDWGPDAKRYTQKVQAIRAVVPTKHAPYDDDDNSWARV